MKKLLIVAFLAIICTACTDYVAWTDIEYKNNSSYDIHFLSASILSNPDMQNIIKTEKIIATLPSGSSCIFSTSGTSPRKGFVSIDSVTSDNAIALIQFGDIVKIYFREKYDMEDLYELVSKKDRYRKYTYTFTDADYQFALENGTVVK